MKENKRLVKLAIVTVLAFWVLFLFIRSAIHVVRIYKEFTQPIPGYHSDVSVCAKNWDKTNVEKQRLYNYLSLGEKCEK